MNRIHLIRQIIICFTFSVFFSVAFADKGIFNPKVTPDEFFTNESGLVTISAEIGAENLHLSSVTAYKTNADGKPISRLGQMYDDGTHGDEREADTIFTTQFSVNEVSEGKIYVRVSAAYQRDRGRYLSPIMEVDFMDHIPEGLVESMNSELAGIKSNFVSNIATKGLDGARNTALQEALNNPNIEEAGLDGAHLSIIYKDGIRGFIVLEDPNNPIDGAGNSFPSVLPENYKSPGNDKLLIFAPGYGDASPQNKIADHAKNRFDSSEFMQFSPNPASITKDTSATLEAVKNWGNYGTVIIHTHGGLWGTSFFGLFGGEVVLSSGTLVTTSSKTTYEKDIKKKRIGIAGGKFIFYPSFITKHAVSMKNTFFYLGACHSLDNNTMWNALKAKGAKVGFGWDESVCRSFNTSKFKELINSMLPNSSADDPKTAKEAYDAIAVKTDNICDENAKFEMRTDSSAWGNFMFLEGGLINGDFETDDWTGWTHSGDYNYRLISGSKKHGGSKSAALGRWDTAFNQESPDPADEPFGYEWFYQDFVVPENITYLKFYWWMETYDTARWDWFDAYIKDTSGNTLKTILSQAGKPGSDYGPYWTTTGWQEVQVDISAYRGQKIRIYFDQRLDGYGDQQRVYVDDVTLEK